MKEVKETLDLATRIKKPISLAALVLLVVTIIALAIVNAGGVQVGVLGYVVIGIVAIVALVTLFYGLVISKPTRTIIRTQGDYSPGEVSGSYSINMSKSRSQKDKITDKVSSVHPDHSSSISIETKGSHSPGRVTGDYNVQENSENS